MNTEEACLTWFGHHEPSQSQQCCISIYISLTTRTSRDVTMPFERWATSTSHSLLEAKSWGNTMVQSTSVVQYNATALGFKVHSAHEAPSRLTPASSIKFLNPAPAPRNHPEPACHSRCFCKAFVCLDNTSRAIHGKDADFLVSSSGARLRLRLYLRTVWWVGLPDAGLAVFAP